MNEQVISMIRAVLPDRVYLGGSCALKKFFFNTPDIIPGDMDFFYYGPRPCERWVMDTLMQSLFTIISRGYSYDGKYVIAGQYWYYCCEHNGTQFDVIFIEEDKIAESLGSSFAGIQYKIDYSPSMLSMPDRTALADCFSLVSKYRKCHVWLPRNTDAQLKKVANRCNLLGIEYKEIKGLLV